MEAASYIFYFDTLQSMRLDVFISEKLSEMTRSQIQKWIKGGQVLVNQKTNKASYLLKKRDKVEIYIPKPRFLELIPENIPLDILYEDSELIVVNKSAERVVHPGAGHWQGTLVHALLAHCQDLSGIGGALRPGIVHRLDKGTSGVMVVAKNDRSHQSLSTQFKEREVSKKYWAFVWGQPKEKEAYIEKALGRSLKNRKKISTQSTRLKTAKTKYRLLKSWQNISLLELMPQTGRTHQLRVHMAEIGHAILCDPLYARQHSRLSKLEKPFQDFLKAQPYQFLHAASLSFKHPTSQKWQCFAAPLREEMQQVLNFLSNF